jgi:hypothetical protein
MRVRGKRTLHSTRNVMIKKLFLIITIFQIHVTLCMEEKQQPTGEITLQTDQQNIITELAARLADLKKADIAFNESINNN